MSKKLIAIVVLFIIVLALANAMVEFSTGESLSTNLTNKRITWVSRGGFMKPILSESVLYALNNDGYIYKIDPVSGNEMGRLTLNGAINYSFSLDGNYIYYISHKRKDVLKRYTLYAIDKNTNNTVWTYPLSGQSSLHVGKGKVFITPNDNSNTENTFIALDGTTGQQLWSYDLSTNTEDNNELAGPAISSEVVIIGIPYLKTLYALSLSTGKVIWKKTLWLSSDSQLIASDTTVFTNVVNFPPREDLLYAFDVMSGEEKWKAPVEGNPFGDLTLTAGQVVLAKEFGYLYSFDQQSGELIWKIKTTNSIGAESTGQNLYMTEYESAAFGGVKYSKITEIDRLTGRKGWQYKFSHETFTSVTPFNNNVYIIVSNGIIQSL